MLDNGRFLQQVLQVFNDLPDALNILVRIKAVALGRPLRGDQGVTPFPGANRDGIDAGQDGYGPDGQQSFPGWSRELCSGHGQFLS